jgi:hypothetical protein
MCGICGITDFSGQRVVPFEDYRQIFNLLAKSGEIGLAFKPPMGWKGHVELDDDQ